jgi:hypothetical protein
VLCAVTTYFNSFFKKIFEISKEKSNYKHGSYFDEQGVELSKMSLLTMRDLENLVKSLIRTAAKLILKKSLINY